ncbi:MAG TPA: penicillin-binding protein 1C, partial [Acidobacteriota bacterium]|nr:penicillin-binding protein 1C [Acidobacteriota bacterium]
MNTIRWFKRNRRRLAWLIGAVVLTVLCLDRYVFPLPHDALRRPHAQFVYSREGRLLNCFTSSDQYWRKPVPLDQVSPLLVRCVLACEDRWFRYHPGVNPFALVSAAVDNIRARRVVRGGSTITMQIARMIEPKERTFKNKIIEILRAFQLELHYSKDELLEFYFNLVPYGGNLEGVGAATLFYFDKSPGALSLSECAILAAIPASPSRLRPDRDAARCRRRRDHVLGYLHDRGVVSSGQYDAARREEMPKRRLSPPTAAPHFCQSVASSFPDTVELASTVDFELQAVCERLAQRHHARLAARDIHNLAIVVLHNPTGEVLALVGSPDFGDSRHHGQINGVLAARSPGSTLKPFVYALAFDKGMLSPATRLADIPVNYHGYEPRNYDDLYHGVVSVRQALVQSFNVPAVNVAAAVGLPDYYALLEAGGLSTLHRKPHEYGLPLVLGACEVNLLELANLYATLARGGIGRDVVQLCTRDATAERRLLSPETCFLISDILSDLERPDLPTSWEFTSDMPRIAWKTGTSYGRKDAWTIGYNPTYTVGVWAGNFSGEGSVDIVGAEIAAPIMLDIFGEITGGTEAEWFAMPDRVEARRVCAVSGKYPGAFCDETVYELMSPGISPAVQCDVHHLILVDRDDGHSLCRFCCDGRNYDEVTVAEWPVTIAAWLAASGQTDPIPPHNPDCHGHPVAAAPVIVSPESGAVYALPAGLPSTYQRILLEASLPPGAAQAHWFIDRRLYASCEAGER